MPSRPLEEPYPAKKLAPVQQQVLDDLRSRGIAITTFQDLVGDADLWCELEADMEEYVARARERLPSFASPKTKDDFLIRRWAHAERGGGLDGSTIPSDSPWLRFATSEQLLSVVNSYRDAYTKLVGFDNMFTVPFPENKRRISSQRWHRDPEDRHVVKCILYFSDVDPEAGPFEYIAGSASGGRYGNAWAWGTSWLTEKGVEERWYPPQDELEALISPSDRVQLVGPKGTLALCETSGFHRGGFARTKPRVVSIHTYVSASADYERSNFAVDWRDDGAELSPQARYALG